MTNWIKKGALWQLDIDHTLVDGPLYSLAAPSLSRGNVLPPRNFHGLPPGTYYPEGGMLQVFTRKKGRFLRLDVQRNEKQLTSLFMAPSLLRPRKKEKTRARKPRPTRVTIELLDDDIVDYIFIPYDGSAMQINVGGNLIKPAKVTIENYYEREKKEKIINYFVYAHDWAYHEADAVIRRYDQLYAIDTNTVKHKSGRRLSVSAILRAETQRLESGVSLLDARTYCLLRGLDIEGKPEIKAWKALFDKLIPLLKSGRMRRIGIVVDSELGRIESLNLRLRPFPDSDLYLPSGVELIFATDSSGTDQFGVNLLISTCHKLAHDSTRQYESLDVKEFDRPDTGHPIISS